MAKTVALRQDQIRGNREGWWSAEHSQAERVAHSESRDRHVGKALVLTDDRGGGGIGAGAIRTATRGCKSEIAERKGAV
jgi:hypothetical protein